CTREPPDALRITLPGYGAITGRLTGLEPAQFQVRVQARATRPYIGVSPELSMVQCDTGHSGQFVIDGLPAEGSPQYILQAVRMLPNALAMPVSAPLECDV